MSAVCRKFKAISLVNEKPPIQEGLRIEGWGALKGASSMGQCCNCLAARAGVAIAAAVGTLIDADVVGA
jgi:hypothetical protein